MTNTNMGGKTQPSQNQWRHKRQYTDFTAEEAAKLPDLPTDNNKRQRLYWYKNKDGRPTYVRGGRKEASKGKHKNQALPSCAHQHCIYRCKICKPASWRNNKVLEIKKRYKLDEAAYIALFEEQDYKCKNPGCRKDVQPFTRFGQVDHMPGTGWGSGKNAKGEWYQFDTGIPATVNGILCLNCNTMIGACHNDAKVLQGGIDYLRMISK